MYESFYGLHDLPFELTSSPRFLFFTAKHREALSTLEYGLSSAKGLTVLLGEAGTGKTTLLRAALASEYCQRVECVILHNPSLTRAEFVETLANAFGLGDKAAESKATLLRDLEAVLRERRSRGVTTALVVDEAQSLTHDILEEIRLLANMEDADAKLLPVVLSGQPEFAARLNEPALRQLKQRVVLRCEVIPFELQETAAYIAARIATAGGEASRLFTREAVSLIHERSGGIARVINVICDNALLTAFALEKRPVDRGVVIEVCKDFDLRRRDGRAPDVGRRGTIDEPAAADVAPANGAPANGGAETSERLADEAATDLKDSRIVAFGSSGR